MTKKKELKKKNKPNDFPRSMRDKHRQPSQRSCRRVETPGGVQELLKHPETSTATRWASRGETHVAPCSTRPLTHTHTQQATSFFSSPRFTEQIYKCTKKQVHKHLKGEPFSHSMHTNAIKKVQHQICEKHSESSDSPHVS